MRFSCPHIISCLIILIVACPASLLFGQVTIVKGVVSDTLSQPIPFTQVLLHEAEGNQIIGFTQSDEDGKYSIKINIPGNFLLIFNAISYESKSYPIELKDKVQNSLVIQDAVLPIKPISFDEIVVQAERPISIRGDTIFFNADDFTRGDETVVEDLLTRLPGIDVDDNGVVRFAGKEIEKVMVEGRDLFKKGYGMVTKNMKAGFVDNVEVLQRYSEKPELKGLEYSDKVALNLSIKEEVKTVLFGNTSVGYNSSNNHEARLALMSVNKKVNHYAFFNSNSLGYDPLGDISQFSYDKNTDQRSSTIFDMEAAPLINVQGKKPALDERRVRFNNSRMGSYNVIYTPNEKFELKALSFATIEKDLFSREGIYSYNIGNISFEDTENNSFTDRLQNGFAKLEATLSSTETSRFEYGGMILQKNRSASRKLIFNRTETDESLNNTARETSHYLNYTNRLNEDNALIFSGKYSSRNFSEGFDVNPFLPQNIFPDNLSIHNAIQNGKVNLESFNLEAKNIKRVSTNFTVDTKAGVNFIGIDAISELLFNKQENNLQAPRKFLNDVILNGNNLYAGVLGRKILGRLSIFGGANMHQVRYKTENKIEAEKEGSNLIYLEPKLGFEWQFKRKNHLQATYLHNATSTSISELMQGYIFSGDRTFTNGLGSFEIFRGHNLLLNYTFGEWIDRFLIYSTMFYNKRDQFSATKTVISPEVNFIGKKQGNFEDIFHLNLSTDLYLSSLKNNLKLNASISSTRSSGNEINNKLFSFNSRNFKFGFEFRSAFDGIFNYMVGNSWVYQSVNTESQKTNVDQFQYMDIYFDFSKKLKLQLIAERYYFGSLEKNNASYFLDGILDYEIISDKWELKFETKNVFNNNRFKKYSLTNIGFESTTHEIVSRYFLVSLNYRI